MKNHKKPWKIYIMAEGNCCGASIGFYLTPEFNRKTEANKHMKKHLELNPTHVAWLSKDWS